MRRQAKVVNFGIIYGISAFGLAKQMGVPNRMASEFIQRYFARHTRVKAYLDETLQTGPGAGVGHHPAGAPAPAPPDQQQPTASCARRRSAAAINTPLQGTAADIIKEAMLEVETGLERPRAWPARCCCRSMMSSSLRCPEPELAATAQAGAPGHAGGSHA